MPVDIKALAEFWDNDTKRKQEMGVYGKKDGTNYFTIKDEGEFEVRILDVGNFYSGVHWGVLEGRDGRNGGTIKCPRAFDGSECPVCELVEQMANSSDPKDREQAMKWQVQIKYPLLLVDLNEKGGEIVPRVYEAPKTVFAGIMKWITNARYGNITDLENGRNVTIVRSYNKAKKMVEYDVQPDPEKTAIDIIQEEIPNLKEVLAPRSYEDIEYAMQNGEYPPRKENEDEKPEKRKKQTERMHSIEHIESDEEEYKSTRTVQKPTRYGKGLPATKTRDEEEDEPKAKNRLMEKRISQREEKKDVEEEKKLENRLGVSAVSERLRKLREQNSKGN